MQCRTPLEEKGDETKLLKRFLLALGVTILTLVACIFAWGLYVFKRDFGPEITPGEKDSEAIQRNVVAIGTGYSHTCAALADGSAHCWGSNLLGQLGDGRPHRSRLPVAIGMQDPIADFICSTECYFPSNSTCALLEDGSVSCWGRNDMGELGDGSRLPRESARKVPGLPPAEKIFGASGTICVLTHGKEVYCWGSNEGGKLGMGTDKGIVLCWGGNQFGQLGDGSMRNRLLPVQIGGMADAVGLGAGWQQSCAIRKSGQVWCWGRNDRGQLGIPADLGTICIIREGTTDLFTGGMDNRSSYPCLTLPQSVPGVEGAVDLGHGTLHTCAVLTTGHVRCWGYNGEGQLGNGTGVGGAIPSDVLGLTSAIEVVAGYGHSCALLRDGTVRCWGRGAVTGKGISTHESDLIPVRVKDLAGVKAISAGADHTCALRDDGTMWCWGGNTSKQLGVGEGRDIFYPQECLDSYACSPHPVPVVDSSKVAGSAY